ncbi:unnamed protein product [Ceratitis capitata]|uniref:(Mediterranean fruit fly) hypothetical protein n=1 Tax=Ceratitis capitata TaxID=7213 RepID=A0A811V879_CERCA|nr:unnamed protein product [Ceratitis capitata]
MVVGLVATASGVDHHHQPLSLMSAHIHANRRTFSTHLNYNKSNEKGKKAKTCTTHIISAQLNVPAATSVRATADNNKSTSYVDIRAQRVFFHVFPFHNLL